MNTIFDHALWVSPLFWTLMLLGAAIILFVHNKIRMDVVALLVMLSFYLSGILSIQEILVGFSDPNIILIALLFKDGEIHLSTGAFVNGVVFQDSMQNGIYQNQKDGKTYVYIQGELTPTDNIPKTGKVRYLGISSYHVNNDTLREGALDNLYGAPPRFGIVGVDMTANFEDKTVAGHLVHASAAKNDNVLAELEGTISGNQFSGTKNDTKLQGAFFGENANEMGGVYINEKEGFSGAFSARHEW